LNDKKEEEKILGYQKFLITLDTEYCRRMKYLIVNWVIIYIILENSLIILEENSKEINV
jgi:hypothetical protein